MSSSAMRHSNESLNPRSGSGPGLRQRGNPLSRALGLLLLLGLLAAGLAGYLALPAPAAAQTPTPPANHDSDGDGLIEISNLAQLNAVRYDLDGNGAADSASNNAAYAAAFPVADGGSVCPSDATCTGYELTADLDFDQNDDGEITAADATYWNDGAGWDRISGEFTGTFDGGGHTIANLYINRSPTDYVGLFSAIGATGAVRNLGLWGVNVAGRVGTGGLAGSNGGTISASYVVGTVSGIGWVGGLAGHNHYSATIRSSYAVVRVSGYDSIGGLAGRNWGTISASYAAGTVSVDGSHVGGLVGENGERNRDPATITASYARGVVRGDAYVGGLAGRRQGTISNSYHDSVISQAYSSHGKSTSELQTPTDYTGIYAAWNLDLDGDNSNDDPWDFGDNTHYPVLKADFNGDNTATWQEFGYQMRRPLILTATASDTQVALSWPDVTETTWPGSPSVSYALYRDGAAVAGYGGSSRSYTDTGLAHGQTYRYRVALLLDGVEAASSAASVWVPVTRADADGDGLIDIGSLAQLNAVRWDLDGDGLADDAANNPDYNAAFPAVSSGSSCVAGGEGEGACAGYELTADLDFDTGESGDRTDDAYWNNGAGWLPIGSENTPFATVFEGNRYTISHLYADRRGGADNGLFGVIAAAGEVRNLDLADVSVRGGGERTGGLASSNYGSVSAVSVTGTVSGKDRVGGLVGQNVGTITKSYATATINGDWFVGGLVGVTEKNGSISASYAVGMVTGRSDVGGLLGASRGDVAASYSAGIVTGDKLVGGLVGTLGLFRRDNSNLKNSYTIAEVKLTGQSLNNHGGLVGELRNGVNTASYYDRSIDQYRA